MRKYIDGGSQSFTIREEPQRAIFQQGKGHVFSDGVQAIPTFVSDADASKVKCHDCGITGASFMWKHATRGKLFCEECVVVIRHALTYEELMAL